MINIKPQIYALLKQVPNCEVAYYRPGNFTTLPLITYTETVNMQTNVAFDTLERYSQLQYQIDIYAETSSQASDIAIAVDTLMRGIGFVRGFASDGFDFENQNYRKIMRYTCIINNNNQQIL